MDNTIHVQSRRWVGRSDRTCFFTDMQVSSVTARAMSVKKPNFLHRLSNVGEGSQPYCRLGFMKFLR